MKEKQTLKYKTETFPNYITFALDKTVIFRRTVNRIWKNMEIIQDFSGIFCHSTKCVYI